MTLALELLSELCEAGVAVTVPSDEPNALDVDGPLDAVTDELMDRLRVHKAEVLSVLRSEQCPPSDHSTNATAVWQALLARLEDDPLFPRHVMEGLRAADAQWGDDPEPADESIEEIDPPAPCPECGKLEMWQTMAGNWRCLRCDPPTTARRWRQSATRLKSKPQNRRG